MERTLRQEAHSTASEATDSGRRSSHRPGFLSRQILKLAKFLSPMTTNFTERAAGRWIMFAWATICPGPGPRFSRPRSDTNVDVESDLPCLGRGPIAGLDLNRRPSGYERCGQKLYLVCLVSLPKVLASASCFYLYPILYPRSNARIHD